MSKAKKCYKWSYRYVSKFSIFGNLGFQSKLIHFSKQTSVGSENGGEQANDVG